MKTIYDIAIIGAGPAGSTLARLLKPEFSVLLLEARTLQLTGSESDGGKKNAAASAQPDTAAAFDPANFPAEVLQPEKCCGGLLAPDARKTLKKLGLNPPAEIYESEQPLRVRALDLQADPCGAPRDLERRYPRKYANLNRPAFERWLLALLPERVDFRPGWRCCFIRRPDANRPGQEQTWTIRARPAAAGRGAEPAPAPSSYGTGPRNRAVNEAPPAEETEFRARCVVGAEGASSLVRRLLQNKKSGTAGLYLAVQDAYPRLADKGGDTGDWDYTAFFHPRLTDFYGWLIPKQDKVLLGLALPLKDARAASFRLELAAKLLAEKGCCLEGDFVRQACLLRRPRPRDLLLGSGGAFLVGEAAGWISPSSSEGFSYAFISAKALAESLNRRLRPGQEADPEKILCAYRARSLGLRLNICWKVCKSRVMYTPWLRRLILRSGLLSG